MKYIIMCGGDYAKWDTPRQMQTFRGEKIIERTIRQLRLHGITDIAISSNDDRFEGFGVPVLRHENDYYAREYNDCDGYWCNAFYPMKCPAVYLHGDVVFSDAAIETIVNTDTDDVQFFASGPPFPPEYPKPYEEPFAWKVVNQEHLRRAIDEVKQLDKHGKFHRKPIAWELWAVIRGQTDVNHIDYNGYIRINDGTCDVDNPNEIPMLERMRI